MKPKADFAVENHGTVWVFTPLTEAAQQFTEDELPLEPWQRHGSSFVIDHRPAAGLVETLEEEGWTFC